MVRFVDESGRTMADMPDHAEIVDFQLLGRRCVNLAECLRRLPRLKILRGVGIDDQDGLEAVRGLEHLQELAIAFGGQSIAPLASCTGLKKLSIGGLVRVDVTPLASLTNLEALGLGGQPTHLQSIGSMTSLRRLAVTFNKRVALRWFANLTNLNELSFVGSRLSDFDFFRMFPRLTKLDLANTNIDSLEHLAENTALETLRLGLCRKLQRLDGIERLTRLTKLDLDDQRSVPSIGPLAALKRLRTLYMRDTRVADSDLSPLTQLPELEEVTVMNEFGEHLAEIARKMPRCNLRIVGRLKSGEPIEHHGEVDILRDTDRKSDSVSYRIDQTLTEVLGVETNDDADELVQGAMERRFPDVLKELEFDTEGEAFVVRSPSVDAVRTVARCINDLKKRSRR